MNNPNDQFLVAQIETIKVIKFPGWCRRGIKRYRNAVVYSLQQCQSGCWKWVKRTEPFTIEQLKCIPECDVGSVCGNKTIWFSDLDDHYPDPGDVVALDLVGGCLMAESDLCQLV